MSEDSRKVLTMAGGRASWQEMTGGLDLDNLSGGQLFVREASEEIIASYALESHQPIAGEDGTLIYSFDDFAGPAIAAGTKYRVKLFEQTWEVVAEPVSGDDLTLPLIGNPGLQEKYREAYGWEDNGLPFFILDIGGNLILAVRAADFTQVTAGSNPANRNFVVWEVRDKELVCLPVVRMVASTSGSGFDDSSDIKTAAELRAAIDNGQTVLVKKGTEGTYLIVGYDSSGENFKGANGGTFQLLD